MYIPFFYRGSVKKLEFTTSMCLKLLETCLKELKFRDDLETICMLIKLLLTSIQRQRQQIARSSDDKEREKKEREVLSELLNILKKRLLIELPSSMERYYKSELLLRELEVNKNINYR